MNSLCNRRGKINKDGLSLPEQKERKKEREMDPLCSSLQLSKEKRKKK
jgi:hypothetical protein